MTTWRELLDRWTRTDLAGELARADSLGAIAQRGMELLFIHGPEPTTRGLLARADFVIDALVKRPGFAMNDRASELILEAASAICLYEVLGIPVGKDLLPWIQPLVKLVPTKRDAPAVHGHWNKALIGMCLDDITIYGPILGLGIGSDNPFVPEQSFQFNIWGTLRHFVAAKAATAWANDYSGAWREFLAHYPTHAATRSANVETILWMGRLVMHHMDSPNKLHDLGALYPVLVAGRATE